jgi:hypothetical protein
LFLLYLISSIYYLFSIFCRRTTFIHTRSFNTYRRYAIHTRRSLVPCGCCHCWSCRPPSSP